MGALAVYQVGHAVNPPLVRWASGHRLARGILGVLEAFVRETGWVGLTVLLSIPLMSDTAVNYLYSLLNEEGKAIPLWRFMLSNAIGDMLRALIFFWILSG